MIQDFVFPDSVDAALDVLVDKDGDARVFAGGTALLRDGSNLIGEPRYYVSLARISELNGITSSNGYIFIGANTTLAQCAADPLILANAPCLAEATRGLASAQVRNMATVTGNICAARPFGDAAVALAALGAECVVRFKEGSREVPITKMYAKVGESVVDSRKEILTHIKFPASVAGEGTAFERLDLRAGLSFPVVNVGVKVRVIDGVIADSAIVAAPLSPGPARVSAAEALLVGQAPTADAFAKAASLASQKVKFRNSPQRCRSTRSDAECSYDVCRFCVNPVRSSGDYRHEVLPVLVSRALTRAAGLAVQSESA